MRAVNGMAWAAVGTVWMIAAGAEAQGTLRAVAEGGDEIRMPLVEERLDVRIDRQHATTVLRQVYQNEQDANVEGLYALALDEGTRVEGFAYWNGETRIVGEVFEKEAAREVYEDVTGIGRDPGLLEQDGEGAFTFRVFPIVPGEMKRIDVTFGRWLRQRGRVIEYRVPLASNRPAIRVSLREDRTVRSVTSPTHALRSRRDEAGVLAIEVGDPRGNARELVLRYEVDEPDWSVQARVHRDPGQDPYVVVSMAVPEGAGEGSVVPRDVTLVIDRSGSMSGTPFEQAKVAARDLVERLPARDRLNVVLFDDGVESLYASPHAVDDETRAEALAYIDRAQIAGGTDIAGALQHALAAQHPGGDRPCFVLFMTDGQSDAAAALAAADEGAGNVRIYTIGVGQGVTRSLLSRLAGSHRGTFTFIPNAAALAPRMATLYDQLSTPILVDLELDVAEGPRPFGRYPRTLPDLFRNDELRAAFRLLPGRDRAQIRLRGKLGGRPFEATKEIAIPSEVDARWVGREWAGTRIDDLLEEIALEGETAERKDEVVGLAIAYSIVTPYTSFLAIPESELTDTARESIERMREHRRQILAANPDAAALSRNAMPPGDPILRVHAPIDAVSVTAYFPFGLTKDLRYDADDETWECRFLVPNDVADGEYRVRIVVVATDGTVRVAEAPYTIDSHAPDLVVDAESAPFGALVRVRTDETARLVTVVPLADPTRRVTLAPNEDGTLFEGVVPLATGRHGLRVVVADVARNESTRVVSVEVAP